MNAVVSSSMADDYVELALRLTPGPLQSSNETRVLLRQGRSGDRRYVVNTWVRSYRNREPKIRADIYSRCHTQMVEYLLDQGRLIVACSPTLDTTIHGWCAAPASDKPIIHYAYVPPELAGMGLARGMIRRLLGSYPDTIETSHFWPYASRRFVYVPYHCRVRA